MTCGTLKRYLVAFPEREQQVEIANSIAGTDARHSIHRKGAELHRDLFRTLLDQLMTAELRVEAVDLCELKALGIEVE